MKVGKINERDDGYVDVELVDITQEELGLLIEKGFNELLKEYIESIENEIKKNKKDEDLIFIKNIKSKNEEYDLYLKYPLIYSDDYLNGTVACERGGCSLPTHEEIEFIFNYMYENMYDKFNTYYIGNSYWIEDVKNDFIQMGLISLLENGMTLLEPLDSRERLFEGGIILPVFRSYK